MNSKPYKFRKPLPKSVITAKRVIEVCVEMNRPSGVRLTIAMCGKKHHKMLREHAGNCWSNWINTPSTSN